MDRARRIGAVATGVIVTCVVVMGLGANHWFRGFVGNVHGTIAGIPSPPAFNIVYPVVVGPGASACMSGVTFETDAGLVQFSAGTYRRPGPGLTVTADGPGYHASGSAAAGYPDNTHQSIAIAPPRRSVVGTLCIRNAGPGRIALTGTNEPRTRSRPQLSVGGQPVQANFAVTLGAARPGSYRGHLSAIVSHASAFRPWFQRGAFVWILLVLAALGIPLAVIAALALAAREPLGIGPEADSVSRPAGPSGSRPPAAITAAGALAVTRALWLRALATHRGLPRWARCWPLAAIVLADALLLAQFGHLNHSFQIDDTVYLGESRTIRDDFVHRALDFVDFGHGIQRLNMYLLALSFWITHAPTAFRLFHVLNGIAFASAAIPAYVIARDLRCPPPTALLAGALTLLVPWAVTTTSLLAEGTAYPLFVWVLLALTRSLSRPSVLRDALALLALAVAPLGRTSLLLLPLGFVVALVLQELYEGAAAGARVTGLPRRLVSRHPLMCAAVLLAALYVLWRIVGGHANDDEHRVLGVYFSATGVHWSLGSVLVRSGYFVSRIAVGVGVIAMILALPWLAGGLRPSASPERRAFTLAGATAAVVVLVTSFPSTLDERYTMYVAPVIVIAAVAALRTPVSVLARVAAGLAVAALLAHYAWAPGDPFSSFAFPADSFFVRNVLPHAPGFLSQQAFIVILVIVLAALVHAAQRRRWGTAAIAVAMALVAWNITHTTLSRFVNEAGAATGPGLNMRSWIDRVTHDSGWAFLASGEGVTNDYLPIWRESAYWNPDLAGQLALSGASVPLGGAGVIPTTQAPDGTLRTARPLPRFIAVPDLYHDIGLAGTPVAHAGYVPATLLRLSEPPRVQWQISGPAPDGWIRTGRVTIRYLRGSLTGRLCGILGLVGPPNYPGRRRFEIVGRGVRVSGALAAGEHSTPGFPLSRLNAGAGGQTARLVVHGHSRFVDGTQVSLGLAGAGVGPCR